MDLKVIAGTPNCTDTNTCPTVMAHPTADADLIVQGYVITDPKILAELDLPEGETAVRIPRELLIRAAQALPADPAEPDTEWSDLELLELSEGTEPETRQLSVSEHDLKWIRMALQNYMDTLDRNDRPVSIYNLIERTERLQHEWNEAVR